MSKTERVMVDLCESDGRRDWIELCNQGGTPCLSFAVGAWSGSVDGAVLRSMRDWLNENVKD